MTSEFFENVWSPAKVCMCNLSIQKILWKHHAVFYCVLINCCAQNIHYLYLSLFVEGMFQNALHITL